MSERTELVAGLKASEARLVEAVAGLSEEAYRFREAEGRWTVLENVEHLMLVEGFLRGAVMRALETAPVDVDTSAKDELVQLLAETRADRIIAREVNVPSGRFASMQEALAAFHIERARTIAFVGTSGAEFRRHVFTHVKFGDLDCRQWMVLLSTHLDRHLRQIDEVLAAFQKNLNTSVPLTAL